MNSKPLLCRILQPVRARSYFTGSWPTIRFCRSISGARGRKTNDAKNQVNEDESVTAPGRFDHRICGQQFYEITSVTIDTFELLGKSGNCDFASEGTAKWSTGRAGSGYSKDAFVPLSEEVDKAQLVLRRFRMVRFPPLS